MRVSSSYIHTPKNTRVLDVDSACAFGVVESLIISQIQYWIDIKVADKDHYKDSFRDGHCWVYNPYWKWQEQLPFYSEMTLRRAFKNLEKIGVIISGNYNKLTYDKTKWYTIDYDKLESIIDDYRASVQIEHMVCSDRTDGSEQYEQTNTKDYSTTTPKKYIECKMVQNSKNVCTNDFSYKVVRKQIRTICGDMGLPSCTIEDIIIYYCEQYYKYIGKHHPKMKNSHYEKIVDFILSSDLGVDFDGYSALIDKHFETDYGKSIDYNMNHFFTDGIIENRSYEMLL